MAEPFAVKSAHIVYFSGTGGTQRAACGFEKALSGKGVATVVTELNRSVYPPTNADLLVLLFPVYAMNAPAPVDEWLVQAPSGSGRRAAVIAVSGGGEMFPNKASRVATIRALEDKGYDVCYEMMFVMPANVFIACEGELYAILLKLCPLIAQRAVEEILSGIRKRSKPSSADIYISRLVSYEKKAAGSFGSHIVVTDACIGCGLCAERCPRQNITMADGKPVFSSRCVICLRCIYRCPKHALVPGKGKILVLKSGFDIESMDRLALETNRFPPSEKMVRHLSMLGVRRYLDEYRGLLEQKKQG